MKYTKLHRHQIIKKNHRVSAIKKYDINNTELYINKYTLIPHPETFKLIQIAEEIILKTSYIKTIADVGTGSGIIAISLAKVFPAKIFYASDITHEILHISKKNARLHKTKNISFLLNRDNIWLSEFNNNSIDFIISNPPYFGEDEYYDRDFLLTHPEVIYEPATALITNGDKSGLQPYLNIVRNSIFTNTKYILFQCNTANIKPLAKQIKSLIPCTITIREDASGLERFLFVQKH